MAAAQHYGSFRSSLSSLDLGQSEERHVTCGKKGISTRAPGAAEIFQYLLADATVCNRSVGIGGEKDGQDTKFSNAHRAPCRGSSKALKRRCPSSALDR